MDALNALTIADARAHLRKRDFTARELAEACLAAMDGAGGLNLIASRTDARCLAMADAADKALQEGGAPALCGIPVGVKELFCVRGIPAQAGSRILEGFTPPYESTVTANLWAEGATLAAMCTMDEFAMGSSNETAFQGPAISPWRRKGSTEPLAPGGSSGGPAGAVAADLCLFAIGTDTGGSIRQPASFCGLVGLKPTYGRCSRRGIVAFASSLDQAGPIAKSVRDAAIALSAMASHDPGDSTSHRTEAQDFERALTGDIRGKRIGIPREYVVEGMGEEITRLWEKAAAALQEAGADIIEVSAPHTAFALPAYYVIAPAEASSNLARYDGVRYGRRAALKEGEGLVAMYEKTRAEGFGAEVRRRVLIGAYVLSHGYYDAYYRRAQRVRRLIRRDFDTLFDTNGTARLDAILTPATPTPPFVLGTQSDDPVSMYLNDIFTVPASLAGLPAISVPAGLSGEGTPLGLQLIGAPFDEGNLLNLAFALERLSAFSARPEKWW